MNAMQRSKWNNCITVFHLFYIHYPSLLRSVPRYIMIFTSNNQDVCIVYFLRITCVVCAFNILQVCPPQIPFHANRTPPPQRSHRNSRILYTAAVHYIWSVSYAARVSNSPKVVGNGCGVTVASDRKCYFIYSFKMPLPF